MERKPIIKSNREIADMSKEIPTDKIHTLLFNSKSIGLLEDCNMESFYRLPQKLKNVEGLYKFLNENCESTYEMFSMLSASLVDIFGQSEELRKTYQRKIR